MAAISMDNEIATHDDPVWRGDANFLIFADLSNEEMPGRWEQLWAHRLGENEFRLCCVPFFAYGLALGDRVATAPRDDKKYVIQSTIAESGHATYRVWFGDAENADATRDMVEMYAKTKRWLFEWSSNNLLAFDIPSGQNEAEIEAFVSEHAHLGIKLESGA